MNPVSQSNPKSASSLPQSLNPSGSGQLCNFCQKRFSTKGSLKTHIKIHLGPPDFNCNFCSYATYSKESLTVHIRSHTKEKPFKCPHPNCLSSFTQSSALKLHQLVHNKGDQRLLRFQCPVPGCPFKTDRKTVLNGHSQVHSDVKPFSCDLCPYRAKLKKTIKQHHQNVHSAERPFKCPQPGCNLCFKHKTDLTRHLKGHSDEPRFVCSFPECTHKTNRKDNLLAHERIHTGEKPFKCSFCPYSFNERGALVVHIRGHTGETPYACKSCSYRGKSSSLLSRHRKRCHSDNKSSLKKRGNSIEPNRKVARVQGQVKSSEYICTVANCGYSTMGNPSLALHLNAAHNLPRVDLSSSKATATF